MGPTHGPEEVIAATASQRNVADRYRIGRLGPPQVPGSRPVGEVELDDEFPEAAVSEGPETNDANDDERASTVPSSCGITFIVDGSVESLSVQTSWGLYREETVDTHVPETGPDGEEVDPDKVPGPQTVYRRTPVEATTSIEISTSASCPVDGETDVQLRWVSRTEGAYRFVTLMLCNNQTGAITDNTQWLFQVQLSITCPSWTEYAGPFVSREEAMPLRQRTADGYDEDAHLQLLYRDRCNFGAGNGTSIGYTPHGRMNGWPRASSVRIEWLPTFEMARVAVAEVPGLELDMTRLAEATPDQLRAGLGPLLAGYSSWLDDQAAAATDLHAHHRDVALQAIDRARELQTRLEDAVTLLIKNEDARRAFSFANRVMAQQRVRSEAIRALGREPGTDWIGLTTGAEEAFDSPDNRSWRPFQLAFVLLCLADVVEPRSHTRSIDPVVELIFFPTGGGKTEAYLGVIAMTMAMRRLQPQLGGYDASEGVAVVMRYTMRLLTGQQYERASAMICAAELLRQKDPGTWGTSPFRIGMWVGRAATPNRRSDAEERLANGQGGIVALTHCPWCGTPIRYKDDAAVYVEAPTAEADWFRVRCCNEHCDFSEGEGLPVLSVDEDVYQHRPTLLIATVDKFAQVAFKPESLHLFGADTRDTPSPIRPPDLWVQDELHLISGPLGSIVGAYEPVLDYLSDWSIDGQRIRPKIIASTATARQADSQVAHLYGRSVAVFPPQVLNADETFFAAPLPLPADDATVHEDESSGRLYVGTSAPGTPLKTLQAVLYETLLSAGRAGTLEAAEDLDDPSHSYATVVGYFSSIRELAGMKRIAEDELGQRLFRINDQWIDQFVEDPQPWKRPGLAPFRTPDGKDRYPELQELTSRLGAERLRDALAELSQPPSVHGKAGGPHVVLATSMISVGVDVPRLGVMVVTTAPKQVSEYVQSSSRVGRDPRRPGLVVVAYQNTRPRDRSQYEQFELFHSRMYSQVEIQSVTPTSRGAIEKVATALLVILARAYHRELRSSEGVRRLSQHADGLHDLIDRVMTDQRLSTDGTPLRDAMHRRLDAIIALAEDPSADLDAVWTNRDAARGAALRPLLFDDGHEEQDSDRLLPNSMRSAEAGINLIVNHLRAEDTNWLSPRPEQSFRAQAAEDQPGSPGDAEDAA